MERRHGAVPDRTVHLHGRRDGRAGLGRVVQSSLVLAPVLFNQKWGDVWIYLVGPLAGGVLGAAIWAFLMLRRPVPDRELETARGGLEP